MKGREHHDHRRSRTRRSTPRARRRRALAPCRLGRPGELRPAVRPARWHDPPLLRAAHRLPRRGRRLGVDRVPRGLAAAGRGRTGRRQRAALAVRHRAPHAAAAVADRPPAPRRARPAAPHGDRHGPRRRGRRAAGRRAPAARPARRRRTPAARRAGRDRALRVAGPGLRLGRGGPRRPGRDRAVPALPRAGPPARRRPVPLDATPEPS